MYEANLLLNCKEVVQLLVAPLPLSFGGKLEVKLQCEIQATYGSYLINKSIWAGVIVGEGFINDQEHDAGEEGQGQDDQNRHLEAVQAHGQ